MRFQGIFAALSVLALSSCDSGAPVIEVDFAKDSSLSGSIQIIPSDVKAAEGRSLIFPFRESDSSLSLPIPQTVTQKVQIQLRYVNSANQRPGAKATELLITSDVVVRGDKDKAQMSAEVANGAGGVTVNGQVLSGVNCDNLLNASAADQVVKISFVGFKSLASCQGADFSRQDPLRIGSRDISKGSNFFSMQDDLRMGQEFTTTFVSQNPGKLYPSSHPASLYAQALMDRIAAVSDMPQLHPRVHVINADVLNAFALPGGEVFVFRGLLTASRSESEIVGVLGHEWAHVTQRHGTRGMTRAIKTIVAAQLGGAIAGALLEAYGDGKKNDLITVAGRVLPALTAGGGQLYLLDKSRDQEADADEIGSQYAWAMRYEPWGLADMFEVFLGKSGHESKIEEFLSDHPALEKRIDHVQGLSALFYPAPGERGYSKTSPRYEEVRQILLAEPWPPKSESIRMGNQFADEITEFTKSNVMKNVGEGARSAQ